MKVAHWSILNGSGMHRVAESLATAERKLGIDSCLADPTATLETLDPLLDCDVHVSHTHVPDSFRQRITKKHNVIWVSHGTPEHVFHTAYESGSKGYGHSDGWMLAQHWLRTADAIVTFWPRHQAVWKSLCDKRTVVDCFPLGVDRTFWKPMPDQSRFAGKPAVFTGENPHYIKWPLDLFIAWPWVAKEVHGNPVLHVAYLPADMHRWFFPLVNRNGASFSSFINAGTLSAEGLRGIFSGVDYFIGLVQKGDFNMLSLQANACGCKTISYAGNPYSDYWLPEGDQRNIAKGLVEILNGPRAARNKEPVPDVSITAQSMISLYARLS